MRLVFVAAFAAMLAGAASAQQRVVIEDDVSHDNAMQCAAMRASQVSAGAPEPLVKAAHDAWLKALEAAHGPKVRDEITALARKITPQQVATLDEACAPFEIRLPTPAG